MSCCYCRSLWFAGSLRNSLTSCAIPLYLATPDLPLQSQAALRGGEAQHVLAPSSGLQLDSQLRMTALTGPCTHGPCVRCRQCQKRQVDQGGTVTSSALRQMRLACICQRWSSVAEAKWTVVRCAQAGLLLFRVSRIRVGSVRRSLRGAHGCF